MPSARERREHAGRVPQPGVPSGPRNTPKKAKRTTPAPEPAGPYPSESSDPKIRRRGREEGAYVPKHGASAKRARRYAAQDKAAATTKKAKKARRITAAKTDRKIAARTDKALDLLKDTKVTPDPQTAASQARLAGIKPPSKDLKRLYGPGAAKKAERAYIQHIAGKEGIHADPIAETVISTAATAGLGGAARLAGMAGKAGVEAIGSRLAGEAGEGAAAAAKSAPRVARAARGARGAEDAAGGARAGARGAGRDARGAKAEEGYAARSARRAKAAGKRRAKARIEDTKLRYSKEGRMVARRTRGVKVGLMSPHLTGTAAGVGSLGVGGAALQGHIDAITHNPGAVAARTIEIAPGLVISTADLAAQAAVAIGTGDPSGLEKRISEEADFAKNLVKTMASGDKGKVQKYVEENGLIVPAMLAPGLGKLGRIGRDARAARAPELDPIGKAEKRVEDLTETGKMKRAYRRRKVRGQTSKDAAREEAEAMAEVKDAGQPIVDAYRGKGRRKGMKARRKLRDKPVDRGDLVAMAAEEGLTPQSARVGFPAIAEKWNKRPRFTDKKQGGVTGHDLVDLVAREPDIWNDPAFWRGVDAYRAQEGDVRTSERVVDVEQAKTYGVQPAAERTPPSVRGDLPTARSRKDVITHLSKSGEGGKRLRRLRETTRAAEGRARELRTELKAIEKAERLRQRRAGKKKDGTPRLAPTVLQERRSRELLDVEADVRGLRAERSGTEARHSRIATALRDPGQEAAAKAEFDSELAKIREDVGLERGVYVPHTDVGSEGMPVAQPVVRAGKKIYERGAGPESLAERGRVDYSLGAVVDAGVQAPRIRKHVHNFVNHQIHEGAIRFPVKTRDGRTEWRRVGTREQFERGLTAEQKRNVVLFPLSQFNQAVKDGSVEQITAAIDSLATEIDWAAETKGHKYVALEPNLAAEIKAQVSSPGSGLHALQIGSRGLSRAILASPAWLMAQVVAESLQASLAINPLNPMNIYHTVAGRRGLAKMSAEERREFRAVAGAMPGMGASPKEWFTADGRTQRGLSANFRKLERVTPIRRLLQAVKLDWLNALDRAKGGEIRVTVAAMKAHKDAMGFGKRLERLVKGERAMSDKLAKMSMSERVAWATKNTANKRKLEGYLDDVLGNWRALSRKEKVASPALIFYPFLRMSLQWPFYSFPKRHPIRAAVMYEMAASHNSQLRALLGGPPAWFGDYATAIVYGDQFKGGAQLMKGTRIVPGANSIFEAVTTGLDVSAQRSLNPVVGYFNALVNGIDPLSGEKVDPDYLSAEERFIARAGLTVSLLFNTPPPLRALDQTEGSKESTSLPFIGPRRKPSALGDLLEQLNGSAQQRAVNTLFNPFPTEDIDHARDKAVMGRIFEIWRVAGSDAQDAVISNDSLPEGEKKRRLKIMRKSSDEADSELHRLYKKYDVSYEEEEKKSSEEYYDLKYPDEESEPAAGGKYAEGNKYTEGNKYLSGNKYTSGNKYGGG